MLQTEIASSLHRTPLTGRLACGVSPCAQVFSPVSCGLQKVILYLC